MPGLIHVIFFGRIACLVSLVTADPQSTLAELPLEKLLNVKQALSKDIARILSGTKPDIEDVKVEVEMDEETQDGAMPLKGDWLQQSKSRKKTAKWPERRGDWDEKGDKKNDLGKIFQTTVTILSFLAFGGYLLCTTIMAIRNNQGFFQTTTVAPTTATRTRRQTPLLAQDSAMVVSLTESLHNLAEGYAKFHFLGKMKN